MPPHVFFYRTAFLVAIAFSSLVYHMASYAQSHVKDPTTPLPDTIAQALQQAKIPAQALSAYVIALNESTPRLAWQEKIARNPASTIKLVTTWSALELLGANYRWRTEVYADRLPINGILHSNIYVRGSGDPKLIPEEMSKLMQALRQAQINEIDGNLVLDKSLFVARPDADQTIDGNIDRPYNVPPDPLLYAFKSLVFSLSPDQNNKIAVTATPALAQLKINNALNQRPHKRRKQSCNAWRAQVQRQGSGIITASFNGNYPLHCGEQQYFISLLSHNEFFWGGFVSEWKNAGGQFTRLPNLSEGHIPATATLIAYHDSPPLLEIINDINKNSNNVMARQLFLTLGIKLNGVPAYGPSTAKALKTWLSTQGLDMPELDIDNGAGLSRTTRISAFHMAKMLQRADNSPLITSLPIVGVDGTMKHRLIDTPAAGNAWIKTGTLKDVRAIAGYANDKLGQRYIVVGMINHDNAMATGKKVLDTLLEWVAQGAQ